MSINRLCGVCVIVALGLGNSVWADLTNGDFSAGLTGWNDGPSGIYGNVDASTGEAVFSETFQTETFSGIMQIFDMPADAGTLSFEFWEGWISDGTVYQGGFIDSFQATIQSSAEADVFTWWADGWVEADYLGSATMDGDPQVDPWATVTFDVTPFAGRSVYLSFDHSAYIDGYQEFIHLDNIRITPVPSPGASLLGILGFGSIGLIKRRFTGRLLNSKQ